jgi:hypothetical protein
VCIKINSQCLEDWKPWQCTVLTFDEGKTAKLHSDKVGQPRMRNATQNSCHDSRPQSGLPFEPTRSDVTCHTSGFPHSVVDVFNLLGCWAISMGSLLMDGVLVPYLGLKMSWPYWTTALHNIPDWRPPNITYWQVQTLTPPKQVSPNSCSD